MNTPAKKLTGRVLLTRNLPTAAAEALCAAGLDIIQIATDDPAPRSELLEQIRGCHATITTLTDRVDDELLIAAGPQLRIVANFAVGFDNIDRDACRRYGVRASNTPGVLTEATADLTWALILAAARRLGEAERLVRAKQWRGWTPLQLLGLELSDATIGIIGAGRIGTAVARRARGFGMSVLYCDPKQKTELEAQHAARRVELDELLATADVVTLHVPLTDATRHLVGGDQLKRMKRTAVLINTSRGPVIDEAALVQALRDHRIAAAGLDVYEREPQLAPGLTDLPNVVLLPHLGSATHTTRTRMAALAAENVLAALWGQEPPNAIA